MGKVLPELIDQDAEDESKVLNLLNLSGSIQYRLTSLKNKRNVEAIA